MPSGQSPQPTRRPTLITVAERAGVSKSLASLVMRDSPHVTREKRDAVWVAARELGYRPNHLARALRTRTNTIGVIISDMENPSWLETVRSLEQCLTHAGINMLLADAHRDADRDIRLADTFLNLRVDALCLIGSREATPEMRAVVAEAPTVVVADEGLRARSMDIVLTDNEVGARLVIDHLLDLGHERVAMVGCADGYAGQVRMAAYRQVMGERGLHHLISIEPTDGSEDGAREAARRLLGRLTRPTAVMAESDYTAVGVLEAAADLDIEVPAELSVTGYDNTYVARIPQVSLTSVDIDNAAVGSAAADYLVTRIARPERRRRERKIRPSLVTRRSTRADGSPDRS